MYVVSCRHFVTTNAIIVQDRWTALIWAAESGLQPVAEMLVNAGASLDIQDKVGVYRKH